MPHYQRTPQHQYSTLEALLAACRQPAGTMLIELPDKMRLFGDATLPDFEQTSIVPLTVPGFGKNKAGFGHGKIHKLLAPVMVQAFEAIQGLGLSYVLKEFGPASTYCVRYAKTDANWALFGGRPEYKGLPNPDKLSWNVLFAQHDQKLGRLRDSLGSKGGTKLEHLSNHCWGTAFDLNPSENPLGTGRLFDLPFEIVQVLGKFGFFWGGYFKKKGADYMHFQWGRKEPPATGFALPSAHVVFPFGQPGKHESPTKYFFLNEHHGRGGYFPLGLYQNLHAGIHLNPLPAEDTAPEDSDLPEDAAELEEELEKDGATEAPATDARAGLLAVRAAVPGYIVAARLPDPKLYADNEVLRKNLEGQPLGFVLVRHELKPVKKPAKKGDGKEPVQEAGQEAGQEPTERWPFYSLYMHLVAPHWGEDSEAERKRDEQLEAAPWLERFLRMEHGGVVALDPDKPDELGKTFWAREAFDADGTSPIPVRGRDEPLARREGEGNQRVVGFGKASPKAIAEAIQSFKKGAVVTFDRPVLPVAAGEIVGFLDGASGTGAGRRYLHWEIFAQAGQGVAKLRELAAKLDLTLPEPLEELRADNFLEMPSLRVPGAPNEIDAFFKQKDPVLNPVITKVPYAKKLVAAFQKGEEFAEGSQQPFRYTTTLKLANPFHFRPEPGTDGAIAVTYLSGGKALETKTEAITELGEHLTLKLDVPAAADVVRLRSKHFRIDLAPPPPPEGTKPDAKAGEKARASINQARRALFKSVTGRRWRDLALEHLNEWTSANLGKYVATKIKAAYFDSTRETDRQKLCKELEEKLAPLTWYAAPKATEQPHGEKTALGEGARQPSIFGGEGTALPQDGHLQSMHPATALWLLDLLLEEGKVALQDAWPADNLIAETVADDPPFLTVVEPSSGAAVGAEVALALVQHGYQLSSTCADSGVAFMAHPEKQKPRILALASYVDGAAVARVRFPFWGKTEIGVRAQGKDGTGARDLKPKAKGKTVLDLPPPESKGMQLSLARAGTGKAKDRQWAGTILVKEGCPQALEGYLAFTYWKADAGQKPDFSRAGLPGNRLWPVVAERASDEEHERDGLRLKGDFVVGLADQKGKKVSARAARLSADYVLADFMNKKVAEAEGAEFRLALPLVQRLQALRDACKVKKEGDRSPLFSASKLEPEGLSLTITSTSIAAVLARAKSLLPSELFSLEANPDGKTAQLTYLPRSGTANLSFTADLGPALQALATAVATNPGEQVFARPSFLAPNGGHHVFSHLEKAPAVAEDGVVAATAEEVRLASARDCIELETDVILPPAHAFGFGPVEIGMGRGCLRTTVALLGPARAWANARPRITCSVDGATIVGGARERDAVAEYWYLEKWTHPKRRSRRVPAPPPQFVTHRWGKTFAFKAEATHTKGMAVPPPPVTGRFVAVPKLRSLEVKLEGEEVVFTGQAEAMPTSSELGLRCERQNATGDATGAWQVAGKVANALVYQRASSASPSAWGGVLETMVFTATAPRSAFGLASYRFTWHAVSFSEEQGEQLPDLTLEVPRFDRLRIAPLTTRTYSGAELGGSAAGDLEEEPDVPRIDDEATDG